MKAAGPRAAWLLGALLPCALGASTLDSTEFHFEGSRYHYRFRAHVDAPPSAVLAVVTDVTQLARTNDSITLVRVLAHSPDGSWTRQLRLRQCVLVFCFDIDFVERVRELPDGVIETTVIPGAGNFRRGIARWQIKAIPDGTTEMVMEADQEPGFWIPPVLGPLLMKHTFVVEVQETIVKIEQLARAVPVR